MITDQVAPEVSPSSTYLRQSAFGHQQLLNTPRYDNVARLISGRLVARPIDQAWSGRLSR